MREFDACQGSVLLGVIVKHWHSLLALANGTFQAYCAGVKVETETARKLRDWQEREKLSQPQAAAKLGTPFATYRNWISGRRNPSTAMRAAIDRILAS